ncbi:MAG: hypothetical protein EOP82_31810 [Variovorax sp.]|nr:MAG: hypothetical protein EOP82_31810 [Variovorax sp.]
MATETKRPVPPTPMGEHEARLGDRGDASGRNIEQNRAVGQDDPMEGSRMGREALKKTGFPGTPDIGTDAAQTKEAEEAEEAKEAKRSGKRRP